MSGRVRGAGTRLRLAAGLGGALALLVFAGCGGSSGDGSSDSGTSASTTPAATTAATTGALSKPAAGGETLKLVQSDYGRVLADKHGEALYLFTADGAKSNCKGDCAKAWPAYTVEAAPGPGAGVDGAKIGTISRSDGSLQVTYAGKPLYYYEGDSPGNILCQGVDEFGGLWYVIQASGEPVT
jgi:predicted lipoprotein with Yx(FWY)xxD motif